jgi:hypothetical protein
MVKNPGATFASAAIAIPTRGDYTPTEKSPRWLAKAICLRYGAHVLYVRCAPVLNKSLYPTHHDDF